MKIEIELTSDSYNSDCGNKALKIDIRRDNIYFSFSDDEREVGVNKEELKKILTILD